MYVCVCQGVTERQIHEAVRNGAGCLRDLRQQLGVTQDCGRCASCAHACLKDAHRDEPQASMRHVCLAVRLRGGSKTPKNSPVKGTDKG